MRVTVRQLVKHFGATPALRSVSLDVAARELFFLLGPSGCGKTTLLRTLAGFYQPDAGEVWFGDRLMNGVPPHERNTGMVFQNYALWPHLSVADNVGYGLDVRRVPAAERRARIAEALATVRMSEHATRAPNQLSGGQQQRVALARALVIRPDVVLLDEPLSNLDARLRLDLREEIRRIHAATRITTIYVTHDQQEALSLADRLAVLRDGVVEQAGTPREVYRRPASRFVADFIGETNWLPGAVTAGADAPRVRTPAGEFTCEPPPALPAGTPVWLGFRPESVVLDRAGVNGFSAELAQVTYLGGSEQYELALADGTRLKLVTPNPRSPRAVGARLELQVHPADVLLLPRAG